MNSRLHILLIVGDPVGGIRKHIHSIIYEIDKREFRISYAFSSTNTDKKFKSDYPLINDLLAGGLIALDVKKLPHPIDIINICKLVNYTVKNKVNIVHGHGAKGGFYARIVSLITGIIAIYTPHGGSMHNMFSSFGELIYSRIEKFLYLFTDVFIFESNYSAKSFKHKISKRLRNYIINYNGIQEYDHKTLAEQSRKCGYGQNREDTINIGVFGMLRPEKGQIIAIKAVGQLLKNGIDLRLHIFGDGPSGNELKILAQDMKLLDYIIFHGELEDIEPHIYGMDIVLISSLFESFPYIALEATSMGRFVVASNVGSIHEIVKDGVNGLLIKAGDSSAIVDGVLKYYKKREYFLNQMRRSVNNGVVFSIDNMISNLSLIYRSYSSSDI